MLTIRARYSTEAVCGHLERSWGWPRRLGRSRKWSQGLWLLLAFAVGFSNACSDDSGPGPLDPDASVEALSLVIVSPGRDVGLFAGGEVKLVVRLEDDQGGGRAGRAVTFSLVGEPAGSVLDRTDRITDDQGLASVNLRAGWTAASFSVEVSAQRVAPVRFDVVVGEAGFGHLQLTLSVEEGSSGRAPTTLGLYLDTPCARISASSVPAKTRTLEDFDAAALFEFLPVDRFISVMAKTSPDDRGRVQTGCIDVPTGTLRKNLTLNGTVVLTAAVPSLGEGYFLETRLALAPSSGTRLAAALGEVRRLGECSYGPASLLVDCLVSSLSHPDVVGEELDCTGDAVGDLAQSLDRARGVVDGRCRSDEDGQGRQGIEALLTEQVADSAMVTRVRSLVSADIEMTNLTLRSYLGVHSTAAGNWAGIHRMVSAWITDAGSQAAVSLNELGSPGLTARDVLVTPLSGTNGLVAFGRQEFVLDLSLVLERVVCRWLFDSEADEELVSGFARYFGSTAGDPQEACIQIDAALCAKLGRESGCLGSSCEVALEAWAARWDRAFESARADRTPDFVFDAGRASLVDRDGDLTAESIGTSDQPGEWDVTVFLADEQLDPETSFTGRITPGLVF